MEDGARRAAEARIARLAGMRVDRAKPDTEFWIYRRDKIDVYFLQRITNDARGDAPVRKGELRPALAAAICVAAGSDKFETVCDPFAGYGAIPRALMNWENPRTILCFDNDLECVKHMEGTLRREGRRLIVKRADSLGFSLKEKPDAFITDPPWGKYGNGPGGGCASESFCLRMLDMLAVNLSSGGALALLVSADGAALHLLEKDGRFVGKKTYGMLVSGKKALLYTGRRE